VAFLAARGRGPVSRGKIDLLLRHWYGSRLAVVSESILIGAVVGCVVAPFRALVSRMQTFREGLYKALPALPWFALPALAACLAAVGLFLGWASYRRPLIRGSGIPQVKGALDGKFRLEWLPDLPLKWVTSL